MSVRLHIGDRPVGADAPAYIVAEAGVNHQCDLDIAREMIEKAKAGGADAIKFQTYNADTLTTRWAPRYWEHPEPSGTQYAIYKDSDDFVREDYEKLFEHARRVGIQWLTTPFDLEAVEWLAEMGMAAYKIASADITNFPLLRAAASKQVPIMISSGGSTLDELRAAVDEIRRVGNQQIILLHCILCYPSPDDQMNLRCIPTLQREFPDVVIGLSDHSVPDPCVTIPTAAVALGAKVIEKHFTLDTSWDGDDHYLSVDPPMLRTMVANIRKAEAALGSGEVRVLECERAAHDYARRSIVAAVDLPAGTVLGPEHLIMKRPGTGVSPTLVDPMVGRRMIRDVAEDQLVTWEDVDGDPPGS
ncbi:MAG TPA: N-acetylneuraminate synthase family protein [Armatimonadota bacterium]|nr:N-acetylneuraminate synthase family protein [Armatimonadota bacterium]